MKRAPKPTRRERRSLAHADFQACESELFTLPFQGRTVPVPYVASWSSELPNFRVAHEPLLPDAPLALFRGSGRRGEGTPILGQMDMGRQRLCILRGLCQVCARPLRRGEAWMAMLFERIELDVGFRNVVREPPACTACLSLALTVCPGLRRAWPLIVQPLETKLVVTKTIPPLGGFGPLTEDGPELVNPDPAKNVVGYLKIGVVTGSQKYTSEEFLTAFPAPEAG